MADVRITLSQEYDFPDGTKVVLAPSGMTSGLQLPTGELLKPWITFELSEEDVEGNEIDRYLPGLELERRGVIPDLLFIREITGDCPVIQMPPERPRAKYMWKERGENGNLVTPLDTSRLYQFPMDLEFASKADAEGYKSDLHPEEDWVLVKVTYAVVS